MAHENFKPIIETTRGNVVECVHYGAVAVVDSNGRLLAGYGDPMTVTFLRSSAKPFQALPLIEMGGAERFNLTEEEVAIICASHSGTDDHFRIVSSIQQKIGIQENNLKCGVHPPMHEPTRLEMVKRGDAPTPNRHNCSGKHTGMLAAAKLLGASPDDYLSPDHPVQQANLQAFAEICNLKTEEIALGVDGCSAPVFAVPLCDAAYGYARLSDPSTLSPARAAACRLITRSMMAYPSMVAGPGRFDTLLMETGRGKIFCKGGAEGYQGIGLLPGVLGKNSPGVGITIKISDGDAAVRAAGTTAVEVLRQLGVLDREQLEDLKRFLTRPVLNWRKLEVGEIRPIFELAYYK